MTPNRLSDHALIGVFILVIGLGFVLTLPWFANQQGLAANLRTSGKDTHPRELP